MAEIENVNLTKTDLGILEQKIINDQAVAEDYEKLDKFLVALGLTGHILNRIKEFNMNSYEEYVLRLNGHDKNSPSQANIKGAALGVISALKSIRGII